MRLIWTCIVSPTKNAWTCGVKQSHCEICYILYYYEGLRSILLWRPLLIVKIKEKQRKITYKKFERKEGRGVGLLS
jgi:hypothetical protein